MANQNLCFQDVRKMFNYDQNLGVMSRKIKTGRNTHAGQQVGSDDMHGYKTVRIGTTSFKLHRLCWFYAHGHWPVGDIDHLNGDRSDSRLSNLRDVPRGVNLQNQRVATSQNKSTGVLGVYPSNKRFTAALSVDGKKKSLGTFDTVDLAHAAYLNAKREFHVGCLI